MSNQSNKHLMEPLNVKNCDNFVVNYCEILIYKLNKLLSNLRLIITMTINIITIIIIYPGVSTLLYKVRLIGGGVMSLLLPPAPAFSNCFSSSATPPKQTKKFSQ